MHFSPSQSILIRLNYTPSRPFWVSSFRNHPARYSKKILFNHFLNFRLTQWIFSVFVCNNQLYPRHNTMHIKRMELRKNILGILVSIHPSTILPIISLSGLVMLLLIRQLFCQLTFTLREVRFMMSITNIPFITVVPLCTD